MSEHKEQCALIKWCDMKGKPYSKIYANANGGKRNIVVAKKLKSEGVRPGVPDLFLPVAKRGFHGLYIELKTKRGKATQQQVDRIAELNEDGYCAVICYGWDAARDQIENYLGG